MLRVEWNTKITVAGSRTRKCKFNHGTPTQAPGVGVGTAGELPVVQIPPETIAPLDPEAPQPAMWLLVPRRSEALSFGPAPAQGSKSRLRVFAESIRYYQLNLVESGSRSAHR